MQTGPCRLCWWSAKRKGKAICHYEDVNGDGAEVDNPYIGCDCFEPADDREPGEDR